MTLAFLVCRQGAEESQDAYSAMYVQVPCPLQVGDRHTAEVLRPMLDSQTSFPLLNGFTEMFECAFSLTTRDRASSNLRYEDRMRSHSGVSARLGVFCVIHVLHTAMGLSLAFFPNVISGVIALALTCRGGGFTSKLRLAFRIRTPSTQ